MLTIRPEQMADLDALALDLFVDRQCERLQARFPERCAELGQDALAELVRRGVDVADSSQIDDEADVACFLEHFLHWHKDLESRPEGHWATAILEDPDLTGPEKVERMDDHVLFELDGWPQ